MSKVSRDNKKKEAKASSSNSQPKVEPKTAKINDGKCCRCVFRNNEKMCTCKKSSENGNHVARKYSCNCFKYND